MKNIILSKMALKGLNAKEVAGKFAISEAEFSRRMSGVHGWKLEDLERLFNMLGIVIMAEEEKDAYEVVRTMMKLGMLKPKQGASE